MLHGEASLAVSVAGVRVRPFAGVTTTHTKHDGFTETGGTALDLIAAAQTARSMRTQIGASTLHDVDGLRIEPRLAWVREHGDLNQTLSARFSGAPFEVSGVQLRRDALAAQVTVSGTVAKGSELFIDARATGDSRQSSYGVQVGLRVSW